MTLLLASVIRPAEAEIAQGVDIVGLKDTSIRAAAPAGGPR
jgi:hypothetical protein